MKKITLNEAIDILLEDLDIMDATPEFNLTSGNRTNKENPAIGKAFINLITSHPSQIKDLEFPIDDACYFTFGKVKVFVDLHTNYFSIKPASGGEFSYTADFIGNALFDSLVNTINKLTSFNDGQIDETTITSSVGGQYSSKYFLDPKNGKGRKPFWPGGALIEPNRSQHEYGVNSFKVKKGVVEESQLGELTNDIIVDAINAENITKLAHFYAKGVMSNEIIAKAIKLKGQVFANKIKVRAKQSLNENDNIYVKDNNIMSRIVTKAELLKEWDESSSNVNKHDLINSIVGDVEETSTAGAVGGQYSKPLGEEHDEDLSKSFTDGEDKFESNTGKDNEIMLKFLSKIENNINSLKNVIETNRGYIGNFNDIKVDIRQSYDRNGNAPIFTTTGSGLASFLVDGETLKKFLRVFRDRYDELSRGSNNRDEIINQLGLDEDDNYAEIPLDEGIFDFLTKNKKQSETKNKLEFPTDSHEDVENGEDDEVIQKLLDKIKSNPSDLTITIWSGKSTGKWHNDIIKYKNIRIEIAPTANVIFLFNENGRSQYFVSTKLINEFKKLFIDLRKDEIGKRSDDSVRKSIHRDLELDEDDNYAEIPLDEDLSSIPELDLDEDELIDNKEVISSEDSDDDLSEMYSKYMNEELDDVQCFEMYSKMAQKGEYPNEEAQRMAEALFEDGFLNEDGSMNETAIFGEQEVEEGTIYAGTNAVPSLQKDPSFVKLNSKTKMDLQNNLKSGNAISLGEDSVEEGLYSNNTSDISKFDEWLREEGIIGYSRRIDNILSGRDKEFSPNELEEYLDDPDGNGFGIYGYTRKITNAWNELVGGESDLDENFSQEEIENNYISQSDNNEVEDNDDELFNKLLNQPEDESEWGDLGENEDLSEYVLEEDLSEYVLNEEISMPGHVKSGLNKIHKANEKNEKDSEKETGFNLKHTNPQGVQFVEKLPSETTNEDDLKKYDNEPNTEEIASTISKGMEDLDYDNKLTPEEKEKHKNGLKPIIDSKEVKDQYGHVTKAMPHANVSDSSNKLGDKLIKNAEKKAEIRKDMPMYNKDKQPVGKQKDLNENDQLEKMKKFIDYTADPIYEAVDNISPLITKLDDGDENEIIKEGDGYTVTRGEQKAINEEIEKMKKLMSYDPRTHLLTKENKTSKDLFEIKKNK